MPPHQMEPLNREPLNRSRVGPPMRELRDEDGRVWIVRERIGDLVTHPNRRSLVFEAEHAMRRLWSYPEHWLALSDEQLIELSWGR